MTMVVKTPAKRQRETPPQEEDFTLKARIIMHNDPFKERAPKEEESRFRALFGCSCVVAFRVWKLLYSYHLLPQAGTMTHLLWTLMFLKVYPSEEAMKKLTGGADNKTIRKWVGSFVSSVASLEPFLVCVCYKNHCLSYPLLSYNCLSCRYVEYADIMERQGKRRCWQ